MKNIFHSDRTYKQTLGYKTIRTKSGLL